MALTPVDIRATFDLAMEKMTLQGISVASILASGLALSMGGLLLQAAGSEKIEISGSRPQIEPPKQEKRFERLPGVGRSSLSEPDTPDAAFTPNAPQRSIILDREALRKLDRDRNWMFVNPYEIDRKASGLDKLEKKNQSKWLDESVEDKSVLEKFFDERSRRSASESRDSRDADDLRRPAARNPFEAARDREDADGRRDHDDKAFLRELSLKAFLNPGEFERDNREQKEHSGAAGQDWRNLSGGRDLTFDKRQELKRQEEQRSLEFQKLLQPRSITPSISGRVDPINTQADPGRQEWNPIAPSSAGPRPAFASGFDRGGGVTPGAQGTTARPAAESNSAMDDFRAPKTFESFGAISLPKTGPSANAPFSFSPASRSVGSSLTAAEPTRRKF
jgi:hypothetical protein